MPNRLRNRNNILVEITGIVLGANHFDHRAIIDASVTLESDGVLDMDIHFDGPAAVDQFETPEDFFRLGRDSGYIFSENFEFLPVPGVIFQRPAQCEGLRVDWFARSI